MMKKTSFCNILSLFALAAVLCLCGGCARQSNAPNAEQLLQQAAALEEDGGALSLPKRICLYEEALTLGLTGDQRQAATLKLEACRRNYFETYIQGSSDLSERQDLEIQVQSLRGRNEQLQRLTDSLKAENTMRRENNAILEATIQKLQRDGKKP